LELTCEEVYARVVNLLRERGDKYYDVLRRILEVDKERGNGSWEWRDVRVWPSTLAMLIKEGIVEVTYRSNRCTMYRLRCPHMVERALNEYRIAIQGGLAPMPGDETYDVPVTEEMLDQLFEPIEGHDDVKRILKYAILSPEPVHVLMIGAPGTGKTLFAMCLEKLPGAMFVAGYRSTKAGLYEVLKQFRPRFLIIDEIDKMRYEDITILINLMEEGRIIKALKDGYEQVELKTWVIGTANTPRIPHFIRSRFEPYIIEFKPYTREEYVRIVPRVLAKIENIPEDIARYIAERLVEMNITDARAARNLARTVKPFIQDKTKAIEVIDTQIAILRKRYCRASLSAYYAQPTYG